MLNAERVSACVLDPVIVIDVVAADISDGVRSEYCLRRETRHGRIGSHADVLQQEKGQVTRERLLHAVGPLVEKNSIAATQHCAACSRQTPSKTEARRKAQIARLQ